MKKLMILSLFLLYVKVGCAQQKWEPEVDFPCLIYESPISDSCIEQAGLHKTANDFRDCFKNYYGKNNITDSVEFAFVPYNYNQSDNIVFSTLMDNSGHYYRINTTLACLKDTINTNYIFQLNRELCKIKNGLIGKVIITDEDVSTFFICVCNGMGIKLFAEYLETVIDQK